MAKGKSTWKYNKLLTARRNYFLGGGDTKQEWADSDIGKFWTGMYTQYVQPNVSTLTDTDTEPEISNPDENTGTKKNTNWGGIAQATMGGVQAIGSMVNNLVSSDINARKNELITGINNQQMPGMGTAGDSFEQILADYNSYSQLGHVTKNQLGAKGAGSIAGDAIGGAASGASAGMAFGPWGALAGGIVGLGTSLFGSFGRNNKAKKAANAVNEYIDYTNAFNDRSLANRTINAQMNQIDNLQANWAAFGGPLFSSGGNIHIKPSKRGTFTAAATRHGMGVQEFASKVLANKEDYSSAMVKKANFARNAAKWKHAFGGELNTHGGDFTNGLLAIGNGGSHEENPLEGVPMGVDQEGTPNLVEEGETIFNDYVFSKRLMVPKAIREKYKLRGTKDLSFAEASKQLAKESEERPNDPISERGMQALMADLANAQEELKAKNQGNSFANGGKINKFDTGGRKRNTYKGVTGYNDAWVDKDGNYSPAYLEMLESVKDNADFWNRHFANQRAYYKNPSNEGSLRWKAIKNFYDANPDFDIDNIELTPEEIAWAYNGAKSGPIGFMHTWDGDSLDINMQTTPTNAGMTPSVTTVATAPNTAATTPAERKKASRYYKNIGTRDNPNYVLVDDANAPLWLRNNKYYYTSNSLVTEGDTDYTDYYYDLEEPIEEGKYLDWLRYAPAVGFGIGAITDAIGATNKPDYSNANTILEATRSAGNYSPVRFNPIGNYLRYSPFDRDFYINKLNAEAGASRRAILQNAGLNRGTGMAAILAADANAQNSLGQLARQAEEYNLAQRQQVGDFNRTTDITNSQGMLQADIANQKAQADLRDFSLKGTLAAAQMREQARLASDAARSANLSGLFQTIGDIGFEEKNASMMDRLIASGYVPGGENFSWKRRSMGGNIKRKKRGLTR